MLTGDLIGRMMGFIRTGLLLRTFRNDIFTSTGRFSANGFDVIFPVFDYRIVKRTEIIDAANRGPYSNAGFGIERQGPRDAYGKRLKGEFQFSTLGIVRSRARTITGIGGYDYTANANLKYRRRANYLTLTSASARRICFRAQAINDSRQASFRRIELRS